MITEKEVEVRLIRFLDPLVTQQEVEHIKYV